jgi:squalene-hopene/tetraprenyl-beta-curcumene cyclase
VKERFGTATAEQASSCGPYGKDRTFAVPILSTCALAGLVEWRKSNSLSSCPLAAGNVCFLRLPVVSYALPALIAVGQLVYHYRPPWGPIIRIIRRLAINKVFEFLNRFNLKAAASRSRPADQVRHLEPAAIGRANHPVARNGTQFLTNSVRPTGGPLTQSRVGHDFSSERTGRGRRATQSRAIGSANDLGATICGLAKPGGWGWTDCPAVFRMLTTPAPAPFAS